MTKEGTKIMDLVDPTKKMSKSSENPKGVIRLLDDADTIRKKIMSATTDSEMIIKFDVENKPGISNLINIYASLSNKSINEVEEIFKDKKYGELKTEVANLVISELSVIQEKYNQIINSDELDLILDEGINFTSQISKQKYELMKEKMGLHR